MAVPEEVLSGGGVGTHSIVGRHAMSARWLKRNAPVVTEVLFTGVWGARPHFVARLVERAKAQAAAALGEDGAEHHAAPELSDNPAAALEGGVKRAGLADGSRDAVPLVGDSVAGVRENPLHESPRGDAPAGAADLEAASSAGELVAAAKVEAEMPELMASTALVMASLVAKARRPAQAEAVKLQPAAYGWRTPFR